MSFSPRYPSFSGLKCLQLSLIHIFQESRNFQPNALLNAVKTQIWIAVTTNLLVAILQKELKLPGSLHRNLQILSFHLFEKIALHELLTRNEFRKPEIGNFNQMELFDL